MSAHTIGSLFAGIGGFDLGFERAGFRTAWACEIDKHCRALLAQKWPEAMLHDDVSTFDPDAFPCPSAITFGPPCQDLSVAGKRAGLEGERSGLFYESTRIISRYVARGLRFAIWENVPGAFTSNGGGDFGLVLRAMAQCGAVDIAWRVLDAQWFGVAQRRRRVFLVADFGGERAGEILFLTESLQGHPAPSREKGEVAPTIPSRSTGGGGLETDFECDGGLISRTVVPDELEVCGTISDGAHNGGGRNGQDSYTGRILPVEVAREPAVAFGAQNSSAQGDGVSFEFSPTLDKSKTSAVFSESKVRRLTPRECERLQGFPDDWTAGQSDSTRYRQLGNAVAVPVAEWIANNVARVLSDE